MGDFGLDENLSRIARAPLAYSPGTSWRYSLAIDVLGAAIERVTGKPLADAVNELVTTPLGMADSGFLAANIERLAVPYANSATEPVKMSDNMDVPLPEGFGVSVRFAPSRVANPNAFPSGGAGMYGTADDVLRALEVFRANQGFLPDDLHTSMNAAHAGPDAQASGPGWGFGYGGAVLVDPAIAATPQSAGTMQWGGVYGHTWFVDRERQLTVVLLTNTAYEGMAGALTVDVRDAVYLA